MYVEVTSQCPRGKICVTNFNFSTYWLQLKSEAATRWCSIKKCSKIFYKIHKKTPVPGSRLLIIFKVSAALLKIGSNTGVFL